MRDSEASFSEINGKLQHWSQGDCVLGNHGFVFAFSPAAPLTEDARREATDAGTSEMAYAESEVRGLMVLSQTCDLVRSCMERPFVEICPLTEVDDDKLREIRKGYRPRYAWVPERAGQHLVADLDRVMTVEKAIVAGWDRQPGCTTDDHRRCLAQTLTRKRGRAAFPDDFASFISPLARRLQEKHDKQSPEGRALQSLREIRLRAAPEWDAPKVEITFYANLVMKLTPSRSRAW